MRSNLSERSVFEEESPQKLKQAEAIMKGALAKILLAALPLAGVLVTALTADAYERPQPQCPLYVCPPYYESSRWHDRRDDNHHSCGHQGWWDYRYRYDADGDSYRRYEHRRSDGNGYLWRPAPDR